MQMINNISITKIKIKKLIQGGSAASIFKMKTMKSLSILANFSIQSMKIIRILRKKEARRIQIKSSMIL
jgi:hypothetical protein